MAYKENYTPVDPDEAEKQPYQKMGDPVKRFKLRKNSKFSYDLVEPAARLTAAGFTMEDLAYAFNVSRTTIITWMQRYPQFKTAINEGRKQEFGRLVRKGIDLACGYYYPTEERTVTKDADGNIRSIKEKESKNFQPPNVSMLKFMLGNLDDSWKEKSDDRRKQVNSEVSGAIEADEVEKLSGKLLDVEFQE